MRSLLPSLEHASRLRVTLEQIEGRKIGQAFAVSSRDPQRGAGGERDCHETGADQLTEAGRNKVEQRAELELADESPADLVQRFELL